MAEYRYLLGRVWRLRGKMGEASEALLLAVRLAPDYIDAFLPLALALNHESRYAAARGYFERYLEARPGDLDALAGLAESEQRLGELALAEQRAAAVLALDPANARAHLEIGLLRAAEGDFAAARQALGQAGAGERFH